MKTKEEIINALEVIRDVCKEHNCSTCPLRHVNMHEGICEIEMETPEYWVLNIEDDAWRAFKL